MNTETFGGFVVGILLGILIMGIISISIGDIVHTKTLDNVCKQLTNNSNAYYDRTRVADEFICEIEHCCHHTCEPVNMGNTRRIDFGKEKKK